MISFSAFESLKDIPLRLTLAEAAKMLNELGEYSATLPTGVFPGKRWLRHDGVYDPRCPPSERRWLLCQFSDPFVDKRGREVCRVETIAIEFVDESGAVLKDQNPELR